MVTNFGQLLLLLLLAFSALCGAGSWPKLLIEPNRQCATGHQVASSSLSSSSVQRAVFGTAFTIAPSFALSFAFGFVFAFHAE